MKLFFYVLIGGLLLSGCNHSQTNGSVQETSQAISQSEIIKQVKDKPITEKYTAGQVIDSLAGKDGMVSWQLFKPKEYANDVDIIGVTGSVKSEFYTGILSFKIMYLYQLSTRKIIYYAGLLNDDEISEYDFVIYYEQKKMLPF